MITKKIISEMCAKMRTFFARKRELSEESPRLQMEFERGASRYPAEQRDDDAGVKHR